MFELERGKVNRRFVKRWKTSDRAAAVRDWEV
jgi:hypothetical protein